MASSSSLVLALRRREAVPMRRGNMNGRSHGWLGGANLAPSGGEKGKIAHAEGRRQAARHGRRREVAWPSQIRAGCGEN
jgi:hypothetical protein